jgi:hypothetical protein
MDTVLLSLIITGDGLIPAEYILLELVIWPLGSNIITGISGNCTGKGLGQRVLLWPAELLVVYIN